MFSGRVGSGWPVITHWLHKLRNVLVSMFLCLGLVFLDGLFYHQPSGLLACCRPVRRRFRLFVAIVRFRVLRLLGAMVDRL